MSWTTQGAFLGLEKGVCLSEGGHGDTVLQGFWPQESRDLGPLTSEP